MLIDSFSHVSSSVSPASFTSAKALRILGTQGEKMRANHSRDWRKWDHDICWEAVFRGNIPKPPFLSCFVYLVFGRLILTDSVACTALLMGSKMHHPSEVKQTVPAAERFGEALDCPEALRHRSCAAALCEVPWSLKRAVAPNKVWISCKAVPGAAQGCVSVMGVLLWELMQF